MEAKYVVKRIVINTNGHIGGGCHSFESKEKMLSYVKRYATTKSKNIKAVVTEVYNEKNIVIGQFEFSDGELNEKVLPGTLSLEEYLEKEQESNNSYSVETWTMSESKPGNDDVISTKKFSTFEEAKKYAQDNAYDAVDELDEETINNIDYVMTSVIEIGETRTTKYRFYNALNKELDTYEEVYNNNIPEAHIIDGNADSEGGEEVEAEVIDLDASKKTDRELMSDVFDADVNFSLEDLMKNPLSLKVFDAKKVYAIKELVSRCMKYETKHIEVRTPEDVAKYCYPRLAYEQKEHFCVMLLNMKNKVVKFETISLGGLNASIVHPREVFKFAIKYSAASIIVVHNHPSGDPTPSREDLQVTRRLVNAGNLLDIEVMDHIIIGSGKYVSLKEQGLLK